MKFFDLKFILPYSGYLRSESPIGGGHNEFGQDSIFPINARFTSIRIRQMCSSISREQRCSSIHMLESIHMYVIRSIELSRISSGHRSDTELPSSKVILYGIGRSRFPLHTRRRQREEELSDLPGFRAHTDPGSGRTLWRRSIAGGHSERTLRSRFVNRRSMSFSVSMGDVQENKSRNQNSHATRPERLNPNVHRHFRRQDSRRELPGPRPETGRFNPGHGSRIPRLRTTLPFQPGPGLFCHSRQKQPQISSHQINARRQEHRSYLRPDHHVNGASNKNKLPRVVASCKVLRFGAKKETRFFDEQFFHQRKDRGGHLSFTMANRIVFQMDKTTFANQGVLWH